MTQSESIAPVKTAHRIAVIDVLRGFAILGILHLNMPLGNNVAWEIFADPRFNGWSELDQAAWVFLTVFTDGTMRGVLQLLFGAGLMLLSAKAMTPDGPVAIADVWYRRNIWLMAFGAFNAFVLLWPGDILFAYGAAAILLFPFRLLKARWLLALGGAFLAYTVVMGVSGYLDRSAEAEFAQSAIAIEKRGGDLAKAQSEAVKEWNEAVANRGMNPEFEERAREHRAAVTDPDPLVYITYSASIWLYLWSDGEVLAFIIEAFFTMLIGMALYKWGFVQGGSSSRVYWSVMLVCYAFGWGTRAAGLPVYLEFTPEPEVTSLFGGLPRLAIAIGHIAALNLLMRSFAAGALTASLGAAGRLAFTLYLMQSFIMQYIIGAPFALGLFDQMNWARVMWVSTLVIVAQVLFAIWWTSRFRFGPLEWIWRSLTHWQRQDMRIVEPRAKGKSAYGPQHAE